MTIFFTNKENKMHIILIEYEERTMVSTTALRYVVDVSISSPLLNFQPRERARPEALIPQDPPPRLRNLRNFSGTGSYRTIKCRQCRCSAHNSRCDRLTKTERIIDGELVGTISAKRTGPIFLRSRHERLHDATTTRKRLRCPQSMSSNICFRTWEKY